MKCPSCESENFVKNGKIHNGKQRFKCKLCGRQFVENPVKKIIGPETIALVEKLLLEKISLAGIARVLEISESWLQKYVNKKYENITHKINVTDKIKGKMTVECDEICSFVGKKENKLWVWLAKDRDSKEIVGASIGSREKEEAYNLWNSMPSVYRQCAVSYTDLWVAYNGVFPRLRHRPVPKGSGGTNNIESFNNVMRQRVARLVRKTSSFSKKKKIISVRYIILYIIIIIKKISDIFISNLSE